TQDGALIRVARGEERLVRITSQTRLPARRPRPGDAILVIGRPTADGAFEARAILIRPLRSARDARLRRQAPQAQ
ncbi:MAG: hypothetical protein ACRDI2_24245, partial [Chloroflexota bacterium]